MNSINITATYTDLDSAIEAAKAAGIDIFAGFEHNIADEKRVSERAGIKEWFLTESGEILFVYEFDGQRIVNNVTLGSTISDGRLYVCNIDCDGKIEIDFDMAVPKSNKEFRRFTCKICDTWHLIDERLAHKLAAA